jgi:hypothetical protein
MYKQLEYLRENTTMVRGQTFRIDLPESGLLSCIALSVTGNCTPNATLVDINWRLQDLMRRIEVIGNGATVIKSYDWKNADFFHWLHCGNSPMNTWRNYAANSQMEYLMLLFGRYPGDPDYGLDLSKWDNVELRVTNASSATYHSADFSSSILQMFHRDHPSGYRGCLRTEVWREWTTVADETRYFILPTEFPLGGVYVRALPAVTLGIANTGFANLMDDLDFSQAGGVKRIYKGGLDDLALVNHYELGHELIVGGESFRNADQGFDIGLGRTLKRGFAATSHSGAALATWASPTADLTGNTFTAENFDGNASLSFIASGYAYQNHGYLWHSKDLSPDTLLDPRQVGDVLLNVHTRNAAASAAGTNQVILERLADK